MSTAANQDSRITGWYREAGKGAPDRFITVSDMLFSWREMPAWAHKLALSNPQPGTGTIADGRIWGGFADGKPVAYCHIRAGFYFSVSVGPDFKSALPGACPHDWIYANADAIAAAWGCSVWSVLRFADHWFLAVLRKSRFGLRGTYYLSVRAFGFAFNRLGRLIRGAQ